MMAMVPIICPVWEQMQPTVQSPSTTREVKIPMFGCDCYAYGLLASGFCDIVCEADLKPYDYMALVPIVLGAGGKMTDWEGEPLKFVVEEEGGDGESFQGEVLAAASERLWKASVASLKKQTR